MMRHAKSSWELEVSDKDRPLQQRGVEDAHRVGSAFYRNGPALDFVFSSPANRALHTCMIFLGETGHPKDRFKVDAALYDFSGESVQSFVEGLDNHLDTVAIFGHNNAFTSLANTWGDRYIENLPTAGLVHLVFDVDRWSEISKGRNEHLLFPKQLNK